MPRLLLFRHAVAERATPGESDHERALTKEGRKDSAEAGRKLAKRGETIDLVLCSSSTRTRETWEGAAPELGGSPEVRYLRSIFEASDYLPILREEGGDAKTIMLVGHNPAMHETAKELPADLSSRAGRALADGFAKAAVAVFDFDGEWKRLKPRQMRLVDFLEP